MMMDIKEEFDLFDILEERIADLEKKGSFGYGMYGTEVHYSGYTFPELLKMLSEGTDHIPPRPVLSIALDFNPLSKSPLKRRLNSYLNLSSPRSIKDVSMVTAKWYADTAKGIFGDTTKLESNSKYTQRLKQKAGVSPQNNPLIWTGELKAHMQYRYGGVIK